MTSLATIKFDIDEGNIIHLLSPADNLDQSQPKLKKDGTPKIICSGNKKKGKKSEVYHFEIDDMKKVINYFADNNKWIYYLLFILSYNLARRVGDMLMLRWVNFYDPQTGLFRNDILEIVEDKTDKLANPHINSACRNAIKKYIDMTGCQPQENGYNNYVFLQLSGNYKGSVLSESGYLKSLKKAAREVGITYNVGTHSPRKTFGMISRMLHPNDPNSMELLRIIYNHSDTKTTSRYIGLTKQQTDAYYDDLGTFFDDYLTGDKEYKGTADKPVVAIDINDLRCIIQKAYEAGRENANIDNLTVHLDAFNALMEMVEEMQK